MLGQVCTQPPCSPRPPSSPLGGAPRVPAPANPAHGEKVKEARSVGTARLRLALLRDSRLKLENKRRPA